MTGTTFWDTCDVSTFRGWVGDHNHPSRVACRQIIKDAGYDSILDVGCGLCTEHDGFQADGYHISYTGVDMCQRWVDLAVNRGLKVECGVITNLPFQPHSFDVVYCRHVLEHLPWYAPAMLELARVAIRAVMVVFFRIPIDEPPDIKVEMGLYHNRYSRLDIESFIRSDLAGFDFGWVSLRDNVLLHMWRK